MTPEMIAITVAVLLIAAMYWDSKFGRIPNWLIMVMVLTYAGQAAMFGTFDYWQLVFAAFVFALGLALFAGGAFGAGAVKLMAATALFMPLSAKGTLGLILLGMVFASLLVFGLLRGRFGGEDSSWVVLTKRIIPMAFPIGVTGLLGLFVIG